MECQEAMDEEKLSTAISEEKAFSDSEIKVQDLFTLSVNLSSSLLVLNVAFCVCLLNLSV